MTNKKQKSCDLVLFDYVLYVGREGTDSCINSAISAWISSLLLVSKKIMYKKVLKQ